MNNIPITLSIKSDAAAPGAVRPHEVRVVPYLHAASRCLGGSLPLSGCTPSDEPVRPAGTMPSKPPPSDDLHTAKVAVHEITAALPDMICIELRDPPLRFGKLYHKADGPIFEGAYAVVNCVASPSGAIRVICRGGPFAPWFFDEGNSAPLLFWGIGGVPSANGLFEGHKVDSNTIDLIDTTFSGSYTSGGHFRQFSAVDTVPACEQCVGMGLRSQW